MYDSPVASQRSAYPGSADQGPARPPAEDGVFTRLDHLEKALAYHRELMDTLRSAVAPVLRPEQLSHVANVNGQTGETKPSIACEVSHRIESFTACLIGMNNEMRTLIERVGL